jgi:phosphoribosylamine--glycine ligase
VAQASAPTKVLVIGGGGREHALAWKLSQSPRVEHVFVAPGNGGMASEAGMSNAVVDMSAVGDFVKANGVGFVVVGPEQPLVDGLVDELRVQGIPCFGPSAAAARLEASKAFSKEFMERSGIPTARFGAFTDYAKAKAYLDAAPFPKVVIKASGLAAGKGVLMPQTPAEAQVALKQVMVDHAFGDAGDEVVIEECLEGDEVSLLAFCDGKGAVVCMPAAQDHKRIFDGDQGPNTGGMGAYAPAPVLTAALTADAHTSVIQKTVNAMMAEGTPYTGVLYAGLMLTADGPRVLEYNCRFGDPETQVLMMLLKSDLFDVMEACVDGTLGSLDVQWHGGSAATVVGASSGYPGSYPKGKAIEGLDALEGGDAKVFHAGTRVSAQGAVEVRWRACARVRYACVVRVARARAVCVCVCACVRVCVCVCVRVFVCVCVPTGSPCVHACCTCLHASLFCCDTTRKRLLTSIFNAQCVTPRYSTPRHVAAVFLPSVHGARRSRPPSRLPTRA